MILKLLILISYCRNNPLKYVDPSGQIFIIDDLIFGVIDSLLSFDFSDTFSRLDNSITIWSNFIQGSKLKVLSKISWESPQQILGLT
ncbi:hypothetical protein MHK_003976 [Candidatus Magnetomorum sp. HK-1]|nr:hypothetical protein MHK_003976 [Candidatus Magnetomorum sp. HK-1]